MRIFHRTLQRLIFSSETECQSLCAYQSGLNSNSERANSSSLPPLCHSLRADSRAYQSPSSHQHHSGLIPALSEAPLLHLRHSRCGSTSILGSYEGERPQCTLHKQRWLLSFVPKLAANFGRWRTESRNFPSWRPGQSSAHSFAVCRTGPEIASPEGRATYSKLWPGCRVLRIYWDRP